MTIMYGRVPWLVAIAVSVGLVACDDRPRPATSEGGVLTFDAAMLLPDAGTRPPDASPLPPDGGPISDAGDRDAGADAGPPDAGPPDAGAPLACSRPEPVGDCVLRVPAGVFGPLTSACLPRCSAETAAAYRACGTQSCRNAALDADPTPGQSYFIGSVRVTTPMDCVACVSYQEFHCFSLVCQEQVDLYVDHCIAGVTPSLCDSSIASVDDCLARLTPSQESIVGACMESRDGPAGCFACD